MKTQIIQTNSVQTKVVTWGSEDRPVLFCLHGLGGTPLSFHELALTLQDHYRIIAPYIPGSGKTEDFPAADGYAMPSLVEWLHEVITQVTGQPVYLLSHSWGAHIGLFFQKSYPNAIQKHLMLDGGYYLRLPEQDSKEVLETDIQQQIDSDNSYTFDNVDDYLEEEKGDVNHWNESMKLAALDRMNDDNGTLRWHLSNDMTAKAFRGIYDALPSDIYPDVKALGLEKTNQLLVATLPESKTERLMFAQKLNEETGIPFERIEQAGHSIHLDQPVVVIEKATAFFK